MTIATTERPPAEVYDEKFVPALFGQWGPVVAGAAGAAAGQTVLDVACGTGALTAAAADIVGPAGRVIGLDSNPDMLVVARRKPGGIEWRDGVAEDLPFDDATFDAVVSQFGFMFFDDRAGALREMMRVLKPGGRLAVAVCGAVQRSPGYGAFALLLDRLFGEEVGNAFRAPFVLGDPGALQRIATDAGIDSASVEERNGAVRFKTIADLVTTEQACVWTLGGILSGDQFELLLRESAEALRAHVEDDGSVSFDMPALLLTAQKSGLVRAEQPFG